MLEFFTYKTPYGFAKSFKKHYTDTNLKQIVILSMALFFINFLNRVFAYAFLDDFMSLQDYEELSILNTIQLAGCVFFFFTARWALKSDKWTLKSKTALSLAFVLYILLIAYFVCYVISFHNTKNTLMLYLAGIVTVSLFICLEIKQITGIAITMCCVYILSIVFRDIKFSEKLINITGAIITSSLLFCFSRYSYYYKSQHFIQLKELEQKNREIELLNIEKNEILAFVAHDLRNPLNNIEGISELLIAEKQNTDLLDLILKSTVHAKKIIDDLLKAEKAEQDLLMEPVNLVAFFKDETKKWQVNSGRKIILQEGTEDVFVKINPSKLQRVTDNLIYNGLKFSKRDTPIEIALSQNNKYVNIAIKDYGIGIPKHLLSQLFDQFSKAGRTGLNGEQSTGLGLHISRKIIEQYGGKLNVSSKENVGSTFVITLPILK